MAKYKIKRFSDGSVIAINKEDGTIKYGIDPSWICADDVQSKELYTNEEISGTTKVVPAETYKSVELIVLEGTVTLGAIPYPVGTFSIEASNGSIIENALTYDASSSNSAYLNYMS